MAMNLRSNIASIDIPDLLGNIVMTDDVSEKIKILQKRLVQLDAELMKIYQIKHQLPLCVLMFEEVIQKTYKEIKECMENRKNTTVTKDFLPLKSGNLEKRKSVAEATQIEKKEWMRSAQLWTNRSNIVENFGVNRQDAVQRLNLELDEVEVPKYRNPYDQISKKLRIDEDFYLSFRGNLREHPINIVNPSSSTLRVDLNVNKSHSSYPPPSMPQFLIDPSKKSRRSWSTELHKKFMIACEKLGGAYVATPKQINEMMGVEGLTNDEIKSHLQKYRIQIQKKPITSSLATTSAVSVPPVISSSSWMGEDHYGRGGSLFQYSTSANHSPFIHMQRPSFSARSGYQGHID